MDFSSSVPRKHPAEPPSFATPSKRRRTAINTPVPLNVRSMLDKSLNSSSFTSTSPIGVVPSTAPRMRMNAPSTPGARRTTAMSTEVPNTVGGGKTRLTELARSFAPKPLQSPFAARFMRNRKPAESSIRFLTHLQNQQVNGIPTRPTARAGAVVSTAMSPSQRPPSPMGLPSSVNGTRRETPSAAPVPAATPARRIHNPNFRSERKPSPKSPGSMFQFKANTNTRASHSPFFCPRAQIPAASSSSAPDSRLTSFASRSSSGGTKARADGIISFFSSSIEKAKQALAGNRADRNEERKQKEKEAVRRKIEEEQRIKRDELFRQEMQREEREREERERIRKAENVEDKAKNGEQDWLDYSAANGTPSFVTEDTIPDSVDYTLNGFHMATFVEESTQYSSIMTSSPAVRMKSQLEQSVVDLNIPTITHDTHEDSSAEESEEEEEEEEGEEHVVKQEPQVICIDSDDDNEEAVNINPVPKFLFSHPRRLPGSEDVEDEEIVEAGEYAEYEEYDEEETGEYDDEEDEEEEEGSEEIAPSSAFKSRGFLDEDEADEAIEQFGEEPADYAEGEEEEREASYIEEETEKDETDNEGVFPWEPKVRFADDVDRSLDSTVVIGGPSQQNSFSPAKEATPVTTPQVDEDQENAAPEIAPSSLAQVAELTPISPVEERIADTDRLSPSRPPTPTAASPMGIVIIDDDASDAEPRQSSPGLVADIEKSTASGLEDTGIYRTKDDVYNQCGKHIGECDEKGYVFADMDNMVIGFISAAGVFHKLQEDPEQRTRSLTSSELRGKPSANDTEYEGEEVEAAEEEEEEGGLEDKGEEEEEEEGGDDEIEADFKRALEEGGEDEIEADFKRALEEGGEDEIEADFKRALEEGREDEIEADFKRALEERGEDEIEADFKRALEERGEDEIEADFKRALEERGEDEIEADFKRALEEGGEDEIEADIKRALEEEGEDAGGDMIEIDNAELEKQLIREATTEAHEQPISPAAEEHDDSMYEEAPSQVIEPEPKTVADEEPMIEEEENVGIDFHDEHENKRDSVPREVIFTPAKEGKDTFFHFHHGKEQLPTPKTPYQLMSNDVLSRSLRINKDGDLVIKAPSPESESDEDETPVDPALEDAAESEKEMEEQILVDPALSETMGGVQVITTDKEKESPVAEIEVTVQVEVEIETEVEAELEEGDEADTTMQTCVEEPSIHYESIVIVEREDGSEVDENEGGGEISPILLPDSVHDRSSMIREFFREGTVEEQVIEWQQGGKKESYHKFSIRMEEGDDEGESESEMEEEGAVEEEAPVDEGVRGGKWNTEGEEEEKTDVDEEEYETGESLYPKLPNQPAFGFMPPTAPSSFDTSGEKLATTPLFGFKPPVTSTSESAGEKLTTAPLFVFTPPTSSPSEPSSAEKLPATPLFSFDLPTVPSVPSFDERLMTAPLFGFKPPAASLPETAGEKLATVPLFAFRPPTAMVAEVSAGATEEVSYPTLATAPIFGFKPTAQPSSFSGEKLANKPLFGFNPPTASSISARGEKLPTAPVFGFKPPTAEPSPFSGEELDKPLFGFNPPTAPPKPAPCEKLPAAPVLGFKPPTVSSSISTSGERLADVPLFAFKPPTFGFIPPTSAPSSTLGEELAAAPLFDFTPPTSMVVEDATETGGAEADVEDANSDAPMSGEEVNVTVDLGLGEDEDVAAVILEDFGGEEYVAKVEDEETVETVKTIPTIVGNGETRESTPVSEHEGMVTPSVEPANKKRKREDATPDAAVPEERQDEEMDNDDNIPPVAFQSKKGRAARASKRGAVRKRKDDAKSVPSKNDNEEEEAEIKEPEMKKRRNTRKKAQEPKELSLEDETMEDEVRTIEAAVVTALDLDVPPKETVELPDGSEVPAVQPEEVDISPGNELRGGKVVEPPSPPKRVTRKRGRETSVEPSAKSTTRSTAKKVSSVKESSLEPETVEPEGEGDEPGAIEPESPHKKKAAVAPRRGRSVSVEPSASFEEPPATRSRAKTPSVKEYSVEPEEQPPARSRAKKTPSVKENSAEPEATGETDIITLRNRKVVVNRHGSVDLSADDTDRSTNTVRRSSRHKKTATGPPSPSSKENVVPTTPKVKRVRKQPVMSAIKEADVEASVKKVRRSKRKEA